MSAAVLGRVGLFGGAFDPPHRAHVALAQAAVDQLGLDVLHVVPTGHAWHKQRPLSDATHRLAMCQLAFEHVRCARVDARETLRDGPTYTIDTLRELQQEYPQAQLFVVMGEDQARVLHTWHEADAIARTATIAVASRADASAIAGKPANVLPGLVTQAVHMPPSSVSATQIRSAAASGHRVAPLVFESVARYIDQHHLYQAA